MLQAILLFTCCARHLTALPTIYDEDLMYPVDRPNGPNHEELKQFFELLQRINLRQPTTDEDAEVALPRFYLPPQTDDDLDQMYDDIQEEPIENPEYFDYPRYVPHMPVKKSDTQRYMGYNNYEDEAEPLPRYRYDERRRSTEEIHHPDALRELETLLNDKRHNSDDNVRQLHSLLKAKAKRSIESERPVEVSTSIPEKENKTGNSIVVTVYESEQAASEKATVSEDGQKEVPLLRPATPKHKLVEVEPESESSEEEAYQPNLGQSDFTDEDKQDERDGSYEASEFTGRLRKRFVTPTDALMNELRGLKHE